MKRLLYLLPAAVFGVLAYLLFTSLHAPPPDEIPSALLGKPAPPIELPPLDRKTPSFRTADLKSGHVTVLNVWASWCVPCRMEAPVLDRLMHIPGTALYGLVYKDRAAQARAFLDEVGNPFARLDLDAKGRAAIDWGVYDVPETFVIDGKGIIRWRYSGPITGEMLSRQLLPAIESARQPQS